MFTDIAVAQSDNPVERELCESRNREAKAYNRAMTAFQAIVCDDRQTAAERELDQALSSAHIVGNLDARLETLRSGSSTYLTARESAGAGIDSIASDINYKLTRSKKTRDDLF
jgi:uncharacterized protein